MCWLVEPMELGHLPWQNYVADVVKQLIAALEPDDIIVGGGNAKLLKRLQQRRQIRRY
jgi:polyphosphate glucokinase